MIAHRGASADCPENTLVAFDEALRQRCDGIELDVQLSRDGVPVVYHDRSLARAGAGELAVAQLDWSDLQRLDAGRWLDMRFSGEHIPSLQDVLTRYASTTQLLLEIKSYEGQAAWDRRLELIRAIAAMVQRIDAGGNVLILSFDLNLLAACHEVAPALRRVLNLRPPPWLPRTLRHRLAELFALSTDIATLRPTFAAGVHRAGLPLFSYTCNTPEQVERSLDAFARGVMTDRPGWLREYLVRRARPGGA